jgi:hypothetical protein
MRKLQQLKSTFLLLFVAFLGSTWGAQRAQADTVGEFTGTWTVYDSIIPFGSNENPGPVGFNQFGADGSHDAFFVINPVTDGTLFNCGSSFPCNTNYSGTFVGGTMTMCLDECLSTTFTAPITGGSYSGDQTVPCIYPYCSIDDYQTFTFTGQWANGWTSVGTFTAGFSQDGAEPSADSAAVSLTTTGRSAVPEPGGITLLGTGMILLVASLPLRLKNSFLAP